MFRNFLKFNSKTACLLYLHYRPVQKIYSESCFIINDLKFQKFSKVLSDYGFNPGQVKRILHAPEAILSLNENELITNLTVWLNFASGDKLFTTLCSCPELLTLNPEFINFRFKELMSLFTKKDISKLLVTCPAVFIDDFSNIEEKVQYIVYMMGVEQKSIVKSCALQFDLHYMKCRHIFLTRAGFYVVKKKQEKSANPPLAKVFSRNIETFLKLSKLTEEEYKSFCDCFKEEELEEDSDSDDL